MARLGIPERTGITAGNPLMMYFWQLKVARWYLAGECSSRRPEL